MGQIVYLAGNSPGEWLLGGVKRFYAGRFHRRMCQRNTLAADAFFGTMTAGATRLSALAAFLTAGASRNQLAEIGLHPALSSEAICDRADSWCDPLAACRPRNWRWLSRPNWNSCLPSTAAAWAG